jgi:hypothetical protein
MYKRQRQRHNHSSIVQEAGSQNLDAQKKQEGNSKREQRGKNGEGNVSGKGHKESGVIKRIKEMNIENKENANKRTKFEIREKIRGS